jgi:hypothetical protein
MVPGVLAPSHFHVGIVVPRLEPALEHLTSILGARWAPTTETDVPVAEPDGSRRVVPLRFAYSCDAPYLEVIEEAPGSVWVCNPHSNLHHIGVWADGLEAGRSRLVGGKCPVEIAGFADETGNPAMYTYHADPLGIRIELVDAALRPMIEATLQ